MAEYIEREALIKESTFMFDYALGHCKCVLVEDILNIPAVDVVEVVRCCDCRYSDVYGKNCFCEYDPIETKSVSPNGYCSSGERRSK